MGGYREMHHCAMCSDAFSSKAAYIQHLATHKEPAMPQLQCPVCPFKFDDSYALETHKVQTGHSGDQYTCDKCGSIFQTQSKFKQHSQFPSPCYADASRTHPIRNKSLYSTRETPVTNPAQAYGRAGDVDLDETASAEAPGVLLYDDSQDAPGRSRTPSDVSGEYCHDCKRSFKSKALYNRHCLSCTVQRPIAKQQSTAAPAVVRPVPSPQASYGTASNPPSRIICRLGGCGRSFRSEVALEQHRRDGHNDLDCGADGRGSKSQSQTTPDQHMKANDSLLCDVGICGKLFQSKAQLVEHKKNSHAVSGQVPPASQPTQSHPAPTAPAASIQAAPNQASKASSLVTAPSNAANGGLICGMNGCPRVFKSEAGLKQHKIDSHSVGGRGLDLLGKDKWMLPQSSRNQLQNAGPYRPSGRAPQQSRGGRHTTPAPTVSVPRHVQAPPAAQQSSWNPARASLPPVHVLNGPSIGVPADINQANDLQGKIMRLLITADIAIQHDGKIVYDGVVWVRVGVDRQNEVASKFDELVHLRKLSKQAQAKQHISRPTVFQEDFVSDYPGSDFEQLPEPWDGSLSVVALCCSKVISETRCEEVVKIAAVDVLTGRPLMSYLVCTSATEKVQDWRATLTGLSSFQDLEAARTRRFKIFKGWMAARTALGKFVDQNTVILGYNLRSDLDALRIRHGRCVDLVKLIEKAAEHRPLSRGQLRLEALLRDLLEVHLPTDPFGRDCLQDAFAVRGLALFSIKHNDKFVKYVKEKAREYERLG